MRAGRGPGGQAINKTNSSVNLTHIPTGIVVQAQPTRSREENRRIARKILAERLELLRAKEAREREADLLAEGRSDGAADDASTVQRADGKKTRKEENRYLAGMYSKQELRDEKERRRKANKAKKQKKKAKDKDKAQDVVAAEVEEDGEEDIIEEPAKL